MSIESFNLKNKEWRKAAYEAQKISAQMEVLHKIIATKVKTYESGLPETAQLNILRAEYTQKSEAAQTAYTDMEKEADTPDTAEG